MLQNRAKAYAVKGDRDKAIADLTEAIRCDGKNIESYQVRCKMYEQKGDLDKAIADQSEVIRLDPKSAAAYDARADSTTAAMSPKRPPPITPRPND